MKRIIVRFGEQRASWALTGAVWLRLFFRSNCLLACSNEFIGDWLPSFASFGFGFGLACGGIGIGIGIGFGTGTGTEVTTTRGTTGTALALTLALACLWVRGGSCVRALQHPSRIGSTRHTHACLQMHVAGHCIMTCGTLVRGTG